ncbi:hypothetical protein MTP99_003503 [Tenebrio molitor]|nr:hypothetical protein MTP99_003503 [Tenebrio molitor]
MINHVLEKYPIDKKYSLSHLVFLHTNLVKITQKLNSCFGLHLFLWIALCVALIVVESHALLYMFLYTRSSINDFTLVIISIKNILLYSFDLCYLSKRCSNLCTEASHFKTILLSTKINIESEENRNSVIALVLKLMNNNLQITACRLFSIDYDLLFKICGTVFSYLFIMLQLDQSNTFGPNVAPNETVFFKE